jgi:hypothetical protein
VILLDQRRDALGTLLGQPLLDLNNKRTGYALSPEIRVDSQPVDVTPPAVERPDDRADDVAPDLGHEDVSGACGDGPPQVVGIVSHAGRGVGLLPEFEDYIYIFQPAPSDGQTTRRRLGHNDLQKVKKPAAGANLPRASFFLPTNQRRRQSRKATFFIAFDWPSVFINT